MKRSPVFFRDKRKWVRLEPQEVLYLEAADNCSLLHTLHDQHIVGRTLKQMMGQMQAFGFQRVHRSFAVNLMAIESIDESGLKVGETWIPIGRKYRTDLLSELHLI